MTTRSRDPLHRPGLAYQHAFDWLAVQLHATGGRVAARATTLFHAVELLRRLPDLPLLPPLAPGLEEAAADLGLSVTAPEQAAQEGLHALALIEPPHADPASLTASLRPGGCLYLVAPGPLGRSPQLSSPPPPPFHYRSMYAHLTRQCRRESTPAPNRPRLPPPRPMT